jgi:hypothetical protein
LNMLTLVALWLGLGLKWNILIWPIKCLRRYNNNLQSPKQTPVLVMMPPLVKPYLLKLYD